MGLGTGHLAVVTVSAVLGDDNTWRRLRLRASADGQDRANKIRRTALLEALLRYLVNEDTDCERLASAGAMQKSISFTLPLGVVFCSMSAPGVTHIRVWADACEARRCNWTTKPWVDSADQSSTASAKVNLIMNARR
jgi:hypothetical protein